jgi:hypothetical protein
MISIAAVMAITGDKQSAAALDRIVADPLVFAVAMAAPPAASKSSNKLRALGATALRSTGAVLEAIRWFETTTATHLLWALTPRVELTANTLQRLAQAAEDSQAAILYSDYFDSKADGSISLHPLIDYQLGSIRDDFDFGHAVLISRAALSGLADLIEKEKAAGEFGGWYDLRLRLSERGPVVHLSEPTYLAAPAVELSDEDAHFSYVDPRNRGYQIEMEQVATAYLKRIKAWLPPPIARPIEDNSAFPVECSVVIPVRNRVKTVGDAVNSALSQEAYFPFNVVVVDNHSTDGTTDALRELAAKNNRLVHVVPSRTDLGIGGCWDEAINAPQCGRYAVQLDSDDLYSSPDVLSRIIAEFRRGGYAALIGSYTIVDFSLKQIPPGLIDHREWTPDNGHNNALRIHGLGAPRAFHVPTLRKIGFPNVSWGEDYAVAIRLCREYPIGRIFDSLYWCRRWEGNSDHALPLETHNRYSTYKDRLRSIELAARLHGAAR